MEKAVEELECAMKRPVIRSQPVVREYGMEVGEIAFVRIPVPALRAREIRKEVRGPSFTVQSRELANSERRMGLDLMMTMKLLQQ